MIELKCENCGKQWDYKGTKKVLAPCPDCRRLVKIPKQEPEAEQPQSE